MLITPKYVNPPKEGKKSWSIKTADNQLYFFDPQAVGMTPVAGQPLECVVADKGKWKVITSMAVVGAAQQAMGGVVGGSFAPWWMPFVSNTVAHAIAAGRCEGPSSIIGWAEAARDAAIELAKPAEEEEPKF